MNPLERCQRRSGTTEQDHSIFAMTTDQGQIASIVSETFRLFVAGIMLLVKDYHTDVIKRREQGAARPDDDVEQALLCAAPGIITLTIAETAVH